MPNFNYGNLRNIHGASIVPPEDQLLMIVLDALAYESYAGLTLAKVRARSAAPELVGQYRNKHDLCRAMLLEAAERVAIAYESVTRDAKVFLASGGKDREAGWKELERLLYRHIYLCFHPENRCYALVAAQESQLPADLRELLPKALHKAFGETLAQMILAVSAVKKPHEAALLACNVTGCINTFIQQPEYCQKVFIGQTRTKPNYANVEDQLNNYFLRSIHANTAMNKLF